MKKLLITGFSGFVARHFVEYLYKNEIEMDILAIDINLPKYDFLHYNTFLKIQFIEIDMLDLEQVQKAVEVFVPDYVLHLAAFSSVAYSWEHPVESFNNNTNIFLNLLTAIKKTNSQCRILSIGSSEGYGNIKDHTSKITEKHKLDPISPYAVARVTQEMLAKIFIENYNLNIVLTRSFNHIGPWQDERFVIPSFIRRILVHKEEKLRLAKIEVGDISVVRDFLDVRDVVHAYYLLLIKGKIGNIYNVCSGKGHSLLEIINLIGVQLDMIVDPIKCQQYIRPKDNKYIVGDNSKILRELGWSPQIPLTKTIEDMIENMNNCLEEL